ncbi:hypothetical protein KUTeg_020868 [Tegillarca granosa]|uniref:SET domain-containing protein n=1 Tax=Tegillarca granosa TaxID=220873 RepID=A0ABQ9E954_TEGGR|nr:hypothetical protein KUTeg_020868 [Tegillarca granosa]
MEQIRPGMFPFFPHQFTAAPFPRENIPLDKFRFPGPAVFPFPSPMWIPPPQPIPSPSLSTPNSTVSSPPGPVSRVFPPPPLGIPTFTFSQEDLDMSLYGYTRNRQHNKCNGHALSGLKLGDLNHGIQRILNQNPSQSPPIHLSTKTTFAGSVHYGVFCTKTVISRGTRYGPFKGRVVNTSEIKTNDDNTLMWEVFQEGKLSHFIDGRGGAGNWMSYVNCARYAQEQNLIAMQVEGDIFYEVCKDIPEGTEILVWYGDCYLQFMGVPVSLKEMADGGLHEEAEGRLRRETDFGYISCTCMKNIALTNVVSVLKASVNLLV